MAITMNGLTQDFLNDLRRLGLDDLVARHASGLDTSSGGPAWVPLAVLSEGAIAGFVAYVVGDDGDPYYVILLTVGAGNAEPLKPGGAMDDLLQSLVREARRSLTPVEA